MPVYNLTEYNKNYSKITGSLWNYYRDEPNSGPEGNINYSVKDSKHLILLTKDYRKIRRQRYRKRS